ncbi:MAG: RNA-binding protein [Nitrospinae bacterium RIFCSPLOWO2_12_39_16]|nr:MAG: RNA-binding protein [Nitrospinae bacterium RIFCSPLOWO2_12_39_16]HAP66564.1 RNA-binding protein [Nitrospinota bacterium]HBA25984.1 RNA-binding protein [Nitrospinota bacterium]
MAKKLYVGNISYQTTEDDLNTLFSQAGNIESVKIINDQYSGRSKGFGFVEFATQDEADKAVSMFNGYTLGERKLIVNEARPQAPKRSGGGFGGGGGGRGRRF